VIGEIPQGLLKKNTMKYSALRFTINEISKKLNLPKSTLRYWEKELGEQIQPMRTRGGQRRYEQRHIKLFERVRTMKNKGMTLREIKRVFTQSYNRNSKMDIPSGASIDLLAPRISELMRHEVNLFLATNHYRQLI
jgi:DNA-binding transcriptional MerR regulator